MRTITAEDLRARIEKGERAFENLEVKGFFSFSPPGVEDMTLWFRGLRFEGTLALDHGRFQGLWLEKSHVDGIILAGEACFGQSGLFIVDSSTGSICLRGASIFGELSLQGSIVSGGLELQQAKLPLALNLNTRQLLKYITVSTRADGEKVHMAAPRVPIIFSGPD